MVTEIIINPITSENPTSAYFDGETIDIFQENDLVVFSINEAKQLRDFLNQLELGD